MNHRGQQDRDEREEEHGGRPPRDTPKQPFDSKQQQRQT